MDTHTMPSPHNRQSDTFTPDAADSRAVTCPFCHSHETEILAIFGSQLSTQQYYCRACHTPFEFMKQDASEE